MRLMSGWAQTTQYLSISVHNEVMYNIQENSV